MNLKLVSATFARITLFAAIYTLFRLDIALAQEQSSGTQDGNQLGQQVAGSNMREGDKLKLEKIANLPAVIQENSALLFWDDALWTVNDSGNEAKLYKISPQTGAILSEYSFTTAQNKDWEALAQSDSFIYIGDIGNNFSKRKDLCIYIIRKTDLLNSAPTPLQTHQIKFQYPEQEVWGTNYQDSEWDAEAMIYYNDSLHIFTKNWAKQYTSHYRIPAKEGEYAAEKVAEIDIEGLVTDATIEPMTGRIALLVYTKSHESFVLFAQDYPNSNFFEGQIRKHKLGHMFKVGQVEGITFGTPAHVYISSEALKIPKIKIRKQPKLVRFRLP